MWENALLSLSLPLPLFYPATRALCLQSAASGVLDASSRMLEADRSDESSGNWPHADALVLHLIDLMDILSTRDHCDRQGLSNVK